MLWDEYRGRKTSYAPETPCKCFTQYESRLSHRTVRSVHDERDSIHHVKDTFDFPTEIGVSGRVDDVDVRAVVLDARAFGEDGDTAFALEVVGVHHTLGEGGVGGVDVFGGVARGR